jgi:uncharacterized coiled-coil protein SlyX
MSKEIPMFDFGKKKREAEEAAEKAKQEQIGKAMRSMSDQIAGQAQTIEKLEEQLAAAKSGATTNDAASKALAQAQAQLKQMRDEMEKMKASATASAAAGKAAAAAGASTAGSVGGAKVTSAKDAASSVLGGSPEATPAPQPAPAAPAATGGLSIGGTAYVQRAGGKNLRLRDAPGLGSNAFAGLPPGTQMTLLAGPVAKDGYPWWNIRAADGREGWVAGTELVTQPE